jgi:hypothetical protein
MALGALRFSRCFVLLAAAALFAVACVSLSLPRATSPFGAPLTRLTTPAARLSVAALLSTATGFRLRLRWLRLRLSPLLLRLRAAALLFAGPRTLRPFVASTPLFGAFGALLGMAAPTPLPMGFRVGAGDRDVGQGNKRTADRDRAVLSASVSQAARHVPARLRAPRRARERS